MFALFIIYQMFFVFCVIAGIGEAELPSTDGTAIHSLNSKAAVSECIQRLSKAVSVCCLLRKKP